MRRHSSHHHQGFSLVELSVVLVILGLLVGGVMAGRHLIASAKQTRMISEIQEYKSAIMHFRERYGSYPGDMPNATSYWSTCTNNTANNPCNGNGDSRIGGFLGFYTNEAFRAWEHLSLAGLIAGNYNASGMTIHSGFLRIVTTSIDENSVPKSAFADDAVYMLGWVDMSLALAPYLFNKEFIAVGSLTPGAGPAQATFGRLFTPEEASLIDQKLDDGNARTGHVYSTVHWPTSPPLCSTAAGAYHLQTRERSCVLLFERETY